MVVIIIINIVVGKFIKKNVVFFFYEFYFKIKVLKYRMMVMLNFIKFNLLIYFDVKKKNNFLFFVGFFILFIVIFFYFVKEISDFVEKMDNVFMVFFFYYCLGKSIINIYVWYVKWLKCFYLNKYDYFIFIFFGGIYIFLLIFLKEKMWLLEKYFLFSINL